MLSCLMTFTDSCGHGNLFWCRKTVCDHTCSDNTGLLVATFGSVVV